MGVFRFKRFDVDDGGCGMKICSDSVLLAAWFLPPLATARTVLDIGAGSGVLSLLAADMLPHARITGVEIDPAAAQTAIHNFSVSPWADRLELVNCSFEQYIPAVKPDAIISNPPYFSNGALAAEAARAGARHQCGLDYRSLIDYAVARLAPGGALGFVSPCDGSPRQESDITAHAEMAGLKVRRLCRVATAPGKRPSRLLWHLEAGESPCRVSLLEMRRADGTYSDPYRQLVEPYYMKL